LVCSFFYMKRVFHRCSLPGITLSLRRLEFIEVFYIFPPVSRSVRLRSLNFQFTLFGLQSLLFFFSLPRKTFFNSATAPVPGFCYRSRLLWKRDRSPFRRDCHAFCQILQPPLFPFSLFLFEKVLPILQYKHFGRDFTARTFSFTGTSFSFSFPDRPSRSCLAATSSLLIFSRRIPSPLCCLFFDPLGLLSKMRSDKEPVGLS